MSDTELHDSDNWAEYRKLALNIFSKTVERHLLLASEDEIYGADGKVDSMRAKEYRSALRQNGEDLAYLMLAASKTPLISSEKYTEIYNCAMSTIMDIDGMT